MKLNDTYVALTYTASDLDTIFNDDWFERVLSEEPNIVLETTYEQLDQLATKTPSSLRRVIVAGMSPAYVTFDDYDNQLKRGISVYATSSGHYRYIDPKTNTVQHFGDSLLSIYFELIATAVMKHVETLTRKADSVDIVDINTLLDITVKLNSLNTFVNELGNAAKEVEAEEQD